MKIFKKVDTLIFKYCDQFKESNAYQQVVDIFSGIDEEKRPYVNAFISFTFFFICFLFLGIFFYKNYSLKQNIQTKKDIESTAKEFISLKTKSNILFNQFVSNPKVNSEADFSSQIKTVLNAAAAGKFKIQETELSELSEGLTKTSATINFNKINSQDLSIVIRNLRIQKKLQFLDSKIEKNETDDLLSGNISVIQYSR